MQRIQINYTSLGLMVALKKKTVGVGALPGLLGGQAGVMDVLNL